MPASTIPSSTRNKHPDALGDAKKMLEEVFVA